MRVAIIGAGLVGSACAKAMILQGACRELVLVDRNADRAHGAATDLAHAATLLSPVDVSAGGYADMAGASLVVITAGINERAGGAVDRDDPRGRLALLPANAAIYADVVPRIAEVAPSALILVVTDPPDALADVAGSYSPTNPVISSGTFLDSLRFQHQLARRLGCLARSIDAQVLGEHGTSQVYVWSRATVGLCSVLDLIEGDVRRFCADVEESVKYTNIEVIEGNQASQHAIGLVCSRIVKAILRDEGLVAPVGTWQADYGVTLSLPSVLGRGGVKRVLRPDLDAHEAQALKASGDALSSALRNIGIVPAGAKRLFQLSRP